MPFWTHSSQPNYHDLQEIQGEKEHGKHHHEDAVCHIWSVGHSTGQMTQSLQQRTLKKGEDEEVISIKSGLRNTSTKGNMWTLFRSWFKQTNRGKVFFEGKVNTS